MEEISEIAKAMYRQAHQQDQAQRRLERGLTVTLRIQGSEYTLGLTRFLVFPSGNEVEVCESAFDMPDWATLERVTKGNYRILRYRWDGRQFVKNVKMGQAHLEKQEILL